MPNGSLRVATYWASGPLEAPPEGLDQIVRVVGPERGEIHFPAQWRELVRRLDEVRSRRDRNLDEKRSELVAWLGAHPDAVGESAVSATDVQRWRAPWRFARLAGDW